MAQPTVLVIEDEQYLADLYTEWLEDEFTVLTATTADEALTKLQQPVDVALVDRRLPRSSGDSLIEIIRERAPGSRVAMVTAVDPDFDVLEMDVDSYLVKPVSYETLVDHVRQLLACNLFDEDVVRYFQLRSKQSAIRSEKSIEELEDSSAYDELQTELKSLRATLDETMRGFEEEDLVSVYRLIDTAEPAEQFRPKTT